MAALPALPTLLPLPEAARKYGYTEAHLRSLIEHGTIKAAMVMGELVVDERTLPQRKEDLPEYKKHAHLKGVPISISEAQRKYDIPHPTIWRWMKAGIIERLGTEKNRVLLNEVDVAYCASIYHNRDPKQGRRLFESNGLPYKPNKPKAGPL